MALTEIVTAIAIDALMLGGFLVLLAKSAMFAVESVVKFSKIAGISELATGFVIVAIATSSPEISVAIFSVHSDNVGITLGDIFGSNVTNIALIAALFLLLSPKKQIEKKTIRNLRPLLLIAAAIPILLLLVNDGSRIIGIALLLFFAFFIYRSIKSDGSRVENSSEPKVSGSAAKQLLLFAAGIVVVLVSAHFIVQSASSIAELTGIRESVLGATIIALGTSLPELTVDLAAVRKKHLDLALGDIIGSSITNVALVLGIVLVLSQAAINFSILSTLIVFVVVVHVLLFFFLRTGRISKWQSITLLAIYALFLAAIYGVQAILGGLKL